MGGDFGSPRLVKGGVRGGFGKETKHCYNHRMGLENVQINKQRLTQVIQTSLTAYDQKTGIFNNIEKHPEEDFISLIKKHGLKINDDKFALHALFFTTQMVHGDSTEFLFKRISNPELIEKHSWIFEPKKVIKHNNKDIIEACTKFFRPGGYSASAFTQWQHNCQIIENNYDGDLRNFLKKNNDDAQKIIDALVVYPRAKTHNKKEFRRYGPKLSRLLIQWVNQYNFYDLKNTNSVCIPIDFHICRISLQTFGVEIDQPIGTHDMTNKILLPILSEIIDENSFSARHISESLWSIGSNCCNKKRCDLCPIDEFCGFLMPRISYDSRGVFDLADIIPRKI